MHRLQPIAFVFLPAGVTPVEAAPIPVTAVHREADGVTLARQPGALRLQVCTDRIVRVIYSPTGAIPKLENFVVIAKWAPVPFQLRDTARAIIISTGKMQVEAAHLSGRGRQLHAL